MSPIGKYFRTYKNAMISIIIILFCFCAVVFALFPAVKKVQDMVSEMQGLSEQTTALQKKLDTLSNLDEETLRNQLTNVLSAVPADRSFPAVFETVEGIALETGVTVMVMGISGGTTLATPSAAKGSAADKKLGTRTIPIAVTVNGMLPAVERFISMAPSVRRLLRVRVFSITFPKEAKPVSVAIEMDAFYEPLPVTIGSAKEILPTLTQGDEAVINRLAEMPLVSAVSATLPPPLVGKVKENPFSP